MVYNCDILYVIENNGCVGFVVELSYVRYCECDFIMIECSLVDVYVLIE